jgi:hypothetical protein
MSRFVLAGAALTLAVGLLGAAPAAAAPEAVTADLVAGSAELRWESGTGGGSVLTIAGPGGMTLRREFARGESPVLSLFDAAGQRLVDGAYRWELSLAPAVDGETRRQLRASRRSGNEGSGVPGGGVVSGSFMIRDGAFVTAGAREETPRTAREASATGGIRNVTAADQVIPDDLIVQGSGCFGFDCVNNESFGFDTIRLKENNLRIKFEDTSTGTFPTNDWQLTANDSASGGSSKFSIEDITGSRVPFTVTAGAATNSIFVDSTGRVGLRTSTPVLDLHIATSNTPAIRLEQNNSGGFTAQTWDIAGNEANFFVRDVTGGSKLSFRIRPGAPTSSLDISADGDVGIGTASPDHALEVERSGATSIGISNTNATGGAATKWFFQVDNDANRTLKISKEGTGGTEVTINNRLDANGATMVVNGSVQATNVVFSSSRSLKHDVQAVDAQDVLARVRELPVSEWRFNEGRQDVRHIGPMAEDFQALFGLNPDSSTISVTDTSGVALAAIQALAAQSEQKDQEIAELRSRLLALEQALLERSAQ